MGAFRGVLKHGISLIKCGLVAYAAAYTILTSHVVYDYFTSHRQWLKENQQNELGIRKFSATINEKAREVTIAGEIHIYNDGESEFARKFVREFDLILHEGSIKQSVPNNAFLKATLPAQLIPLAYYQLATGRDLTNPTIHDYALGYKIPIIKIENETNGGIDIMTLEQKILF